jgi:uncharacterized protein YecE (DUF72 family)
MPLRIGISGWTYAPWRGVFFPKGLPQKQELEYASRRLNSIEINGTFYALQRPASYKAWEAATPEDFQFSVKANRYITHIRRLKDVEEPLSHFFASGPLCLKQKLGPILWQFPPSFRFEPKLLRAFFELLPKDTASAARLARLYENKFGEEGLPEHQGTRPLRYAMEIRHASFETKDFIELLREYAIALVVADTAGKWPFLEDVTSDFVYLRLHGDQELYASGYTEAALKEWARKIRAWAKGNIPNRIQCISTGGKIAPNGRDVFVYFDNDIKVKAPFDAMALAHRLGLKERSGE